MKRIQHTTELRPLGCLTSPMELAGTAETPWRQYPTDGAAFDDDEDDDDLDDETDGEWRDPSPHSEAPRTKTDQPPGTPSGGSGGAATPHLDRFGVDLTRAAEEGKLDPVVGREREIERMAQILTRRKKNNPILIGEPGVGKSAIVEGLAQRIASRQVSYFLQGKRLVALDLAGMVAGTKYRGEFEARVKNVMNELRQNPDIIIFIDEIHTMIGAGNAAGGMDAAGMLKPALARGEVQCIGATTVDEYRKSIERDGALERRFQRVMVEPTTADETLQILHNLRGRYEEHHRVRFTDEALAACVKLADRYVTDRNFPDKAIDALDEAGSCMHLSSSEVPDDIIELEQRLVEARRGKDRAILAQQYEEAATLRDVERQVEAMLRVARTAWQQRDELRRPIVDADKVAEVVARMTGVPVTKVASTEGQKLLALADTLRSHIIGQDRAIGRVVRAIQRNRIGLKDPQRPIGTFLFLGPTGVGKTYLAKRLAEEMFASSASLIRVDMTEFMEKHTVSKLIGAPPGYVGYDEGGQLTERVRRHPYSVILFDEIEKAHPDVYNLMLQIFDEGHLTDSYGRRVSFKNTIIIMTSNVGSRQLKDFGTGIGFSARSEAEEGTLAEGVIRKALGRTFSPEFLNRIDDIISFEQLSRPDIRRIVDLELRALERRIAEMGYTLDVRADVRDFLALRGYDRQMGARPLRRAIATYLEDELCDSLLRAGIPLGESESQAAADAPTRIVVTMPDGAMGTDGEPTQDAKPDFEFIQPAAAHQLAAAE